MVSELDAEAADLAINRNTVVNTWIADRLRVLRTSITHHCTIGPTCAAQIATWTDHAKKQPFGGRIFAQSVQPANREAQIGPIGRTIRTERLAATATLTLQHRMCSICGPQSNRLSRSDAVHPVAGTYRTDFTQSITGSPWIEQIRCGAAVRHRQPARPARPVRHRQRARNNESERTERQEPGTYRRIPGSKRAVKLHLSHRFTPGKCGIATPKTIDMPYDGQYGYTTSRQQAHP